MGGQREGHSDDAENREEMAQKTHGDAGGDNHDAKVTHARLTRPVSLARPRMMRGPAGSRVQSCP